MATSTDDSTATILALQERVKSLQTRLTVAVGLLHEAAHRPGNGSGWHNWFGSWKRRTTAWLREAT